MPATWSTRRAISWIPDKNLGYTARHGVTLANLETGQSATILNVIIERDPEFLRHLTGLDMVPGATVKVADKAAYDGTMTIEVNGIARAIGREAASMIIVKTE
jgi:Fe2+ transport system protein FeoA